MPLVPGLSASIRQQGPESGAMLDGEPVEIIVADDSAVDVPEFDDKGKIIRIKHPNGDLTISLDGSPLGSSEENKPEKWFDNLCDQVDSAELSRIADELLRLIDEDIETRREWIEERAQGIKLLALKVEVPTTQGSTDGAPIEGQSRFRHPLLQEAVLRFQANARSELLPSDGPVKLRVDTSASQVDVDKLANALEVDMNHYLTSTATEYYPDTDRMLLMLGFGGTAFKKVYYCPIRQRPVSETVDADDLIVNNSATDLANAKRITHRSYLRPSVVRRLQLLDVYRDIDLSTPLQPKLDAVQQQKKDSQGIRLQSIRPDDRDREIFECYCELDIKGFEHKIKGEPTGLEIPYRVTIDVSSRQIISLVRNYDEDTKELPVARQAFVKYTYVPGFGFYDIGLLHILGNTTNAITAVWRELMDAGMYACFPGFLIAKGGARQQTNIFRVPPGGGAQVETNGMPINQAIMPLPYKEPSPALMALAQEAAQTGARVGGTSEAQVGEGKSDAPVGTTLSLIEQSTKILNAVHKRMHAAQAEEFRLLIECFKEHPKSFWQRNKKPANQWDEQTFLKALEDNDLVPQADPNTASFGQRALKYYGLMTLATQFPQLFNIIEIVQDIITNVLGMANPQQYMAPTSAMAKPTPEAQAQMAKAQLDQAKGAEANAKAQAIASGRGLNGKGGEGLAGKPLDPLDGQAKMLDAQTRAKKVQLDAHADRMKAHEEAAQRLQDTHDNQTKLAIETMRDRQQMALDATKHQDEVLMKRGEMQQNAAHSAQDAMMRRYELGQDASAKQAEFQHKSAESEAARAHEAKQAKAAANMKPKTPQ